MTVWTEEQFEERQAEIIAEGVRLRGPSVAEQFAQLPQKDRDGFFEQLRPVEWQRLLHDWRFWGRPKQLLPLDPGRYDDVLLLGGRGTGKTRTGAETWADRIQRGLHRSLCFIGADWEDTRRTMVGGLPDTDSGILDVMPPWYPRDSAEGIVFNQNKKEIYIPPHDCTIYLNTGNKKEQRGGNFDGIWIDEPIKFRYLETVLVNLDMALRKGVPLRMFTTTPKRQQWLRELIMAAGVLVIHAVTNENRHNLARRFVARLVERYGGTRIAEQEMGARILGDNDNAIATSTAIEQGRVEEAPEIFDETIVAIDPAVSTKRKSDETGIVGAGRVGKKSAADARLYLLEDLSGRYKPDGWARAAVKLAIEIEAVAIVVERNKIGDLGEAVLQHALREAGMLGKVAIREAYSMKDKGTRATESLQPLYERDRVHHVGRYPELESQLTQWDPTVDAISPNNLDAFVHAAIELMGLAITEFKPDVEKQWRGLAERNRRFRVPGRDTI